MTNKKYTIDITMTATLRPNIFKQTIDSFFNNMFDDYRAAGHQLNLVLNIDPVGNKDIDESFCIPFVKGKFDKVIISTPPKASFPKAFKYNWTHIYDDTDYVFNLEDDWVLTQRIDWQKLLNVMDNKKNLAILRLAAFYAMGLKMKNWNKYFKYNSLYYVCPEELKGSVGFCGHPSFIKAEFVRNTAKYLDEIRNPEKQFHNRGRTPVMNEVYKWEYGVWSIPGSQPLISDIGRRWMVENGFRKKGTKAFFIEWEKV